jgi:hypothetical protein
MIMNLREMGCGNVDWIDQAEDRDQWIARRKETTGKAKT